MSTLRSFVVIGLFIILVPFNMIAIDNYMNMKTEEYFYENARSVFSNDEIIYSNDPDLDTSQYTMFQCDNIKMETLTSPNTNYGFTVGLQINFQLETIDGPVTFYPMISGDRYTTGNHDYKNRWADDMYSYRVVTTTEPQYYTQDNMGIEAIREMYHDLKKNSYACGLKLSKRGRTIDGYIFNTIDNVYSDEIVYNNIESEFDLNVSSYVQMKMSAQLKDKAEYILVFLIDIIVLFYLFVSYIKCNNVKRNDVKHNDVKRNGSASETIEPVPSFHVNETPPPAYGMYDCT